jgi:hypothetical protein
VTAAAALAALALAAAPPAGGELVPGASFGGLRLGATPAQVRTAWGGAFGRCRSCTDPTWYYNYVTFRPQGVAVTFRRAHAVAFFTVWQPAGWHTEQGLVLGDDAARITSLYGPLPLVACGGYTAYVLRRRAAQTVFYVVGAKLYGFALAPAGAAACR